MADARICKVKRFDVMTDKFSVGKICRTNYIVSSSQGENWQNKTETNDMFKIAGNRNSERNELPPARDATIRQRFITRLRSECSNMALRTRDL